MKLIYIFAFMILDNLSFGYASNALAATIKSIPPSKQFYVVGVAGFDTQKKYPDDLESNLVAEGSELAGPWLFLPTKKLSPLIVDSFYLTHFSDESQLQQVLNHLKNDGQCRADLGLIIVGNSWGVHNTQRLAEMYQQQCGRLVDLVISIDGVAKPMPTPFRSILPAQKCLNFYEKDSFIHGSPLKNCKNFSLQQIDQLSKSDPSFYSRIIPLDESHVGIEWEGSILSYNLINDYLRDQSEDSSSHAKDTLYDKWSAQVLN